MSHELYEPSNGTQGMAFTSAFCDCCKHDRVHPETGKVLKRCDILSRSMIHNIDHPDYPVEWRYNDADQAVCVAHDFWDWDELGRPPSDTSNVIANPNQQEMFGKKK